MDISQPRKSDNEFLYTLFRRNYTRNTYLWLLCLLNSIVVHLDSDQLIAFQFFQIILSTIIHGFKSRLDKLFFNRIAYTYKAISNIFVVVQSRRFVTNNQKYLIYPLLINLYLCTCILYKWRSLWTKRVNIAEIQSAVGSIYK